MSKSIGILGAGAVGSYIGGFLTREGYDVTLIDMWGAHVNAMNDSGLNVSGTQGDFNVAVNAVHLADAYQLQNKFDYAFLALKSYDTEWGAHFLKRFLSPTGAIVSSQNCMNDRLIASIGRTRTRNSVRYVRYHRRPLGARPRHTRRTARAGPGPRRVPNRRASRAGHAPGRGVGGHGELHRRRQDYD